MHTIPEVPARAVCEPEANFVMNVVAMICGVGVIAFIWVATAGLDMSAGFF